MGYFKQQQIELDDGRLYQPLTDNEQLAYAKWADQNKDEMYQRYLNLEPGVRDCAFQTQTLNLQKHYYQTLSKLLLLLHHDLFHLNPLFQHSTI